MPQTFDTSRRVEFRDTDSAGLMHFTAFFTKMEEVEHEFLRSLGTSVVVYEGDSKLSWPRVKASCDYQGGTRFEDELTVQLSILRLGTKSVTYGFTFTRGEKSIATGEMTSVYCRFDSGKPPQALQVPADLAQKMSVYVVESAE